MKFRWIHPLTFPVSSLAACLALGFHDLLLQRFVAVPQDFPVGSSLAKFQLVLNLSRAVC